MAFLPLVCYGYILLRCHISPHPQHLFSHVTPCTDPMPLKRESDQWVSSQRLLHIFFSRLLLAQHTEYGQDPACKPTRDGMHSVIQGTALCLLIKNDKSREQGRDLDVIKQQLAPKLQTGQPYKVIRCRVPCSTEKGCISISTIVIILNMYLCMHISMSQPVLSFSYVAVNDLSKDISHFLSTR